MHVEAMLRLAGRQGSLPADTASAGPPTRHQESHPGGRFLLCL